MEQITIAVGANRDNIEDTDVNVRVDATTSIWRNEITIWFDIMETIATLTSGLSTKQGDT